MRDLIRRLDEGAEEENPLAEGMEAGRTIADMRVSVGLMARYLAEVGESPEAVSMVYSFATLLNHINGLILGQRKPNVDRLVKARAILDDAVGKMIRIERL